MNSETLVLKQKTLLLSNVNLKCDYKLSCITLTVVVAFNQMLSVKNVNWIECYVMFMLGLKINNLKIDSSTSTINLFAKRKNTKKKSENI